MEKLTAEVNELKHKYNELKHIAKIRHSDLTAKNNQVMILDFSSTFFCCLLPSSSADNTWLDLNPFRIKP